MAGTVKTLFTNKYLSTLKTFTATRCCIPNVLQPQIVRCLYAKTTLGLDGFELQRQKVRENMVNIADKFRVRMTEYTKPDSKNMIFTEDLKNMVHLAENDEDIELVVRMMKRFNQQNKQLRFGSYVFGPVVLRMLYKYNKPDLALELFKSPEMVGFFDQLMSYQILLDLLYENQHYQDVLDTYPVIKDRQLEGTKFPRNIVTLLMAACYKINTAESLEFALSVWKDLTNAGHLPMRRAFTFCAGLALNQGKPELCLELLSGVTNITYTTVRNLRVAALVEVGRLEEALDMLKSIIQLDQPTNIQHTFNRDVLERVKKAVNAADKPDLSLEFNRLQQLFQKEGHISETTLDNQLCAEIRTPPMLNKRQTHMNRNVYPQRIQNVNQYKIYNNHRPGIKDLL